MAGKGSKQRPTNIKEFNKNFDTMKKRQSIEGFVSKKGKLTKKY